MLNKQLYGQEYSESQLPFEEHIEKIEHAVIRVVLKTNGFENIVHSSVQLSGSEGLKIFHGKEVLEIAANEQVHIMPNDERFQNGTIRICSKGEGKLIVHSLNRGCGTPSYNGEFELYATEEGIVVINEIPLETYLYAVVPSEMPASYEIEALKCQAVCARSYAYCHMQTMAYPEYQAHVDDSTTYQVYGNSKVHENTVRAVDETRGKMLTYKGNIIKTYYFSTSCGKTTSIEAWGSKLNESNMYLQGVNIGTYEKELPWYRWKAVISEDILSRQIEENVNQSIGKLKNVAVTKEGIGGIALQLTVTGTKETIVIETENKIRKALGGSGYKIEKNDGTVADSKSLLPSAFFTIHKEGTDYVIEGGGHGHGIGMSQNAANEMAKNGKDYEEILEFFYPGTKVK